MAENPTERPTAVPLPDNVKQVRLATDNNPFPAAVTLVKMDAYGVAKRTHEANQHTFGIDRQHLADRLRQLAELVEKGLVLAQKVSFASEALVEDFTTTTMTFTFAEKIQVAGSSDQSSKAMSAR